MSDNETTKRTILIAEDDTALLSALEIRIEAAGYRVIKVQDGYQALDRCLKEKPDLLLMDINMPAGSGPSVQRRLQESGELASMPVIYITGDQSESVIRTVKKLGGFGIVYKPIHTNELLRLISAAIDQGDSAELDAA